jgi:hypothetical protein
MNSHGDISDANGSVVGGGLQWPLGYRGTLRFPRLILYIPHYLERDRTPAAMEYTNQTTELNNTFAILFGRLRKIAATKKPP